MPERIKAGTSESGRRIVAEEASNVTVSCFVKGDRDKNRKQPDRDKINQVHTLVVYSQIRTCAMYALTRERARTRTCPPGDSRPRDIEYNCSCVRYSPDLKSERTSGQHSEFS